MKNIIKNIKWAVRHPLYALCWARFKQPYSAIYTIAAVLALLAVINSGCVTNPTTGNNELDPAVAQSVAFDVALLSGGALRDKYNGELQLTYTALDTLVKAGGNDVAALQAALQNLPIGVLQGTNGAVIASPSAVLIQQGAQLLLRLDKSQMGSKYVLPIATGLRDGLKTALGLQNFGRVDWNKIHDMSDMISELDSGLYHRGVRKVENCSNERLGIRIPRTEFDSVFVTKTKPEYGTP